MSTGNGPPDPGSYPEGSKSAVRNSRSPPRSNRTEGVITGASASDPIVATTPAPAGRSTVVLTSGSSSERRVSTVVPPLRVPVQTPEPSDTGTSPDGPYAQTPISVGSAPVAVNSTVSPATDRTC